MCIRDRHNLVEAPAEVPEVLRHVVFNIERGQTLHETIDFLNMLSLIHI